MTGDEFVRRFRSLLIEMPRYNVKHVQAENCDYSDTAIKSANCYYSFCTFYCEDVYFGRYSRQCRSCSGVTFCVNCEGCIECTDCINCWFLSSCRDCRDCSESDFCIDCSSCSDCFGCIGLHRAQYCLFNEQLSEPEYRAWIKAIDLSDSNTLSLIASRIEALRKETCLLGIHTFRTENCIGDHLAECTNCFQCYDSFKLEDCLYNIEANGNRDCCDLSVCFEAELCFNCVQAPLNYNCNFLLHSDSCSDSEFCAYSKNLKNCFGCVYLADKEYCILNRPVPAEGYSDLVDSLRKELIIKSCYSLELFFATDYERQRFCSESDSAVQSILEREEGPR
jgi:hypothetical protein